MTNDDLCLTPDYSCGQSHLVTSATIRMILKGRQITIDPKDGLTSYEHLCTRLSHPQSPPEEPKKKQFATISTTPTDCTS
jgi:hypothetical protein